MIGLNLITEVLPEANVSRRKACYYLQYRYRQRKYEYLEIALCPDRQETTIPWLLNLHQGLRWNVPCTALGSFVSNGRHPIKCFSMTDGSFLSRSIGLHISLDTYTTVIIILSLLIMVQLIFLTFSKACLAGSCLLGKQNAQQW